MMNESLKADARRFRLSLAASVFLNIGLLTLVGGLGRTADMSHPASRPHLRMVTFSPHPAPPDSGHRGSETGSRLTTPILPSPQTPPQHVPPPRTLPRPLVPQTPVREAATPRPAFRIVTAKRLSARTIMHPVALDPLVQAPPLPYIPLPVRLPASSVSITAAPAISVTVPPTPTAAPPTPSSSAVPTPMPDTGHVAARQESSRGTTGEGAGWNSGAGSYTNQKAGGPFGIGDGLADSGVTRHIVYVLDTSGSMKTRIDRAEDELIEALRGLRPGETFNIIAFSGGSRLFDPDMAEATPGMVQKASGFLSDLEVGGDTDLEDAVVRALMLRDVNEVVILTDGVPTTGETDWKKLAGALRRFNLRHARISTIGMVGKNPDGTDGSFEAAQLLQQIARDSGGVAKIISLGSAAP